MSKKVLRTAMNAVALNNTAQVTSTKAAPDTSDRDDDNYSLIVVAGLILCVWALCSIARIRQYCRKRKTTEFRRSGDSQSVESDNREVFAMQCAERSASQACFVISVSPPPTYESIFDPRAVPPPIDKKDESDHLGSASRLGSFPTNWMDKREDDQGLPSYDAALKLRADGYV